MYHLFISLSFLMFLFFTVISCAKNDSSDLNSLTSPDFTGKKYYFGFGQHESNTMMNNEITYDVRHTNDIFTKKIGGDYIGKTILDITPQPHNPNVMNVIADLKTKMTKDDMYVQYSSGHGYGGGLAIGIEYNDLRDQILSMSAQEIIVFNMSCESGSMIDSFDEKRAIWQDWLKKGRTLFLMSSSQSGENSQTGPGTDPQEPNGPDGSAGSAFGHSLWKALIGHADGFVDGVKDGFISLDEIVQFTIWKTKQVGGHTPVVAGSYQPGLIMNKVPSKEYLKSLLETGDISYEEFDELTNY